MKQLDEYLMVADAAMFLGISQNTLKKWGDDGLIAVRVNPPKRRQIVRARGFRAIPELFGEVGRQKAEGQTSGRPR